MPIIVACPQCRGQLRVADELIGRKVRCPACRTTFDGIEDRQAPTPAPTPPERAADTPPLVPPMDLELPIETKTIDPWKQLSLELTTEGEEKPVQKRAIEIPNIPEKNEPEPPERPRRSHREKEEDLIRCPSCRRMVHRDSRRCLSCGERLYSDEDRDDDDDRPRRRPPPRLDAEPHRGAFVLTMGIISCAAPFVCWPLAPFAIVFGIIAWVAGSADLRKIRQGMMDQQGEGTTQAGWICGIIGTLVNTLVILGCGAFIGLMTVESINSSKQNNPRPFAVPPPKRAVPGK